MTNKKFLLLDVETTGLNRPEIVSLAYKVVGEQMMSFGYFKPATKEIEPGASAVNHITNRQVKDLPVFQKGQPDFDKLQELLNTHVLVAHNVSFDGRVLSDAGMIIGEVLCTKKLAQEKLTMFSSHSLQYLRYALDLDINTPAHTAYGDVLVLEALFKHLMSM